MNKMFVEGVQMIVPSLRELLPSYLVRFIIYIMQEL